MAGRAGAPHRDVLAGPWITEGRSAVLRQVMHADHPALGPPADTVRRRHEPATRVLRPHAADERAFVPAYRIWLRIVQKPRHAAFAGFVGHAVDDHALLVWGAPPPVDAVVALEAAVDAVAHRPARTEL